MVLAVAIKLPLFYTSAFEQPRPDDSLFYKSILSFLNSNLASVPKIYPILTIILLIAQALMINSFINRHRMTGRQSFLPAMSYILISSLLPDWNYFSAPLLVNTIFLFILSALFSTYNNDKSKGVIFNTGLAAGIAVYLYFPSIFFGVWMLLALMVLRPFRLNEWALCLTGIITPCYFYAVYLFISDQWSWQALFPPVDIRFPALQQSIWLAGSVFLIVVPFLIGAWYVQNNLRKMLIQVRKGWTLLLLYLLIAVFVPLAGENQTFESWIIAVLPFAVFHGCAYLYSTFRIVPVLLFWLTIAFILGWQYAGPAWA